MPELAGKTAVITGAGRGLGRTVAAGLAERGANVVLVARSAEQLAETARGMGLDDKRVLCVSTDVSRIEAVDGLKSRVLDRFGSPQIVINAAGIFGPIQLVGQSDPRAWIETISVNVIGHYLVCRAFVDGMVQQCWGRIVNFSSAASLHPPGPLNSAYATSKAALNRFTRHLAAELAGTGVTANVIHPGEVKTAMWAEIHETSQAAGAPGEGHRAWANKVERTGGDDPRKALDLILELIDDKSSGTNGQFLWIADGLQKPLPSW